MERIVLRHQGKNAMSSLLKKLRMGFVSILVVVAAAFGGYKVFPILFDDRSDSHDSRAIQSLSREEQVVLMRLGIQGIAEKNEAGKFPFLKINIPGSERATFLQYEFNAKLGIEGRDVKVEQTADNEYLVTIPEFVFIGHSDESFRLVTEANGILSWATPKIDTVEMINKVLNEDEQDAYISKNEDILKDQAKFFYGNIFKGIDPDIEVKFEFASDKN